MGTFFELFLEATGKQRTVLKQNSSYNLIKYIHLLWLFILKCDPYEKENLFAI